MIATIRELDAQTHRVHGGGRRPEPDTRVDPALLAAWNYRQDRARAAYEAHKAYLALADAQWAAAGARMFGETT